jgi:hypothetical protein
MLILVCLLSITLRDTLVHPRIIIIFFFSVRIVLCCVFCFVFQCHVPNVTGVFGLSILDCPFVCLWRLSWTARPLIKMCGMFLLMIIPLVSSNFTYETSAVLRTIKSVKRLRNHLAFKYFGFERIWWRLFQSVSDEGYFRAYLMKAISEREKNRNGSTWPSFGGKSQCFT